jgi:hypothetical protein
MQSLDHLLVALLVLVLLLVQLQAQYPDLAECEDEWPEDL